MSEWNRNSMYSLTHKIILWQSLYGNSLYQLMMLVLFYIIVMMLFYVYRVNSSKKVENFNKDSLNFMGPFMRDRNFRSFFCFWEFFFAWCFNFLYCWLILFMMKFVIFPLSCSMTMFKSSEKISFSCTTRSFHSLTMNYKKLSKRSSSLRTKYRTCLHSCFF